MKVTASEILAAQELGGGYQVYARFILLFDKVLGLLEQLDLDEISAAQRGDILYYVNTHLKNAVKKLSYTR